MSKLRTIEIDEVTAGVLEARAAARGVSVGEVVAELVAFDDGAISAEPDEIAELERRWAAIQAGDPSVPQSEVARWLETWGTPTFKSWRER